MKDRIPEKNPSVLATKINKKDENRSSGANTASIMKELATSADRDYIPTIINGIEICRSYKDNEAEDKASLDTAEFNEIQSIPYEPNYPQIVKAIKYEPLPAVVVDVKALKSNLALFSRAVEGLDVTIRVASKSLRNPYLILLALGQPGFKGVMSFSLSETKLLYELGVDDILIAYPTSQPSDLKILRELVEKGANVSIVVDCEEHMRLIQQVMAGSEKQVRVLIDMDMSLRYFNGRIHLGVRRSPIHTDHDLRNILRTSRQYSAVKVMGAMAYEATVAGVQDRSPFASTSVNWIKSVIRKLSVKDVAARRARVPDIFQSEGFDLEVFNGGGTGSINYALKEKALTEVTVGSGILDSHLFDYYSNLQNEWRLKPAIFVALPCDRASDAKYVTVKTGGQFIASGESGKDRNPIPVYPENLETVGTEGLGEVQTPLKIVNKKKTDNKNVPISLKIGDLVLFRSAKSGEPADRVKDYVLVSDGEITAHAKTYRGLGQ